MAATLGHQRSDTKVVQGGLVFYETVLAGGSILPGSLVIRGADDDHVVVAGANSAAVLGVADLVPTERVSGTRGGQTVGTAIAVNQPCRVAKGIFLFRALLASGQNVTKGARAAAAASGEVKAAAATNPIVGIFEESVDASGGALPCLTRFAPGGVA